jgi:hypothetical protein
VTPADVNTARECGWPWSKLGEIEAALDEAKQAAAIALEAGDPSDRLAAQHELEAAFERKQLARQRIADLFQLMLRCAMDAGGLGFNEVVATFTEVAVAAAQRKALERIAALERRLDAVEWLAVELEAVRGVA